MTYIFPFHSSEQSTCYLVSKISFVIWENDPNMILEQVSFCVLVHLSVQYSISLLESNWKSYYSTNSTRHLLQTEKLNCAEVVVCDKMFWELGHVGFNCLLFRCLIPLLTKYVIMIITQFKILLCSDKSDTVWAAADTHFLEQHFLEFLNFSLRVVKTCISLWTLPRFYHSGSMLSFRFQSLDLNLYPDSWSLLSFLCWFKTEEVPGAHATRSLADSSLVKK